MTQRKQAAAAAVVDDLLDVAADPMTDMRALLLIVFTHLDECRECRDPMLVSSREHLPQMRLSEFRVLWQKTLMTPRCVPERLGPPVEQRVERVIAYLVSCRLASNPAEVTL